MTKEDILRMAQQAEPVNVAGPAHLAPKPAPGLEFDERGVLVPQQAEPVEPAFHGFMSADGTRVDVCFTPSAPRTDGTYATAYYTAPPQRKPLTVTKLLPRKLPEDNDE